MEARVKTQDALFLPVPNTQLYWVMCRSDETKGAFVPVPPLPFPLKRERLDFSPKEESPDPHNSLSSSSSSCLVVESNSSAPWTSSETKHLRRLAKQYSHWNVIAEKLNTQVYGISNVRSQEECLERWKDLETRNRRHWSRENEEQLLRAWKESPGDWTRIGREMGRTAAAVKNKWEKLVRAGKQRYSESCVTAVVGALLKHEF